MSELINRLHDKDIYARYRNGTCTSDIPAVDLFIGLTNVPKSPFDNVVGWIKISKEGVNYE